MKFLTIFLLIIVCSAPVLALTVSPAKHERTTPAGIHEFVFTITNNGEAQTIEIGFEGDAAQYATAPQSIDVPAQSRVVMNVKLDTTNMVPGKHELLVLFRETTRGDGMIGSIVEIAPKIIILVPYDGIYLEQTLGMQDWRNPLHATLVVHNYGLQDTTITPHISFERQETGEQKEFDLETRTLDALSYERYAFSLSALPAGIYDLKIQSADTLNSFVAHLGTPTFRVNRAELSSFSPGEIGRINVQAYSDWNEPLDVIVRANITANNGQSWVLEEVTTVFDPDANIELFWESTNADYQNYTLFLELITESTRGFVTASFALEETKESSFTMIVLLIIIALLAVILVIHRVLLSRNKE